jgi:hypothetical protein
MNRRDSRSILIVEADRFPWVTPDEPSLDFYPGQELASALDQALRSKGLATSGAFRTSESHCIELDVANDQFWIVVDWVIIGPNRGVAAWTITIERRCGCLASFFTSSPTDEELAPAIAVLDDIAKSELLGSNPRWYTLDEVIKLETKRVVPS